MPLVHVDERRRPPQHIVAATMHQVGKQASPQETFATFIGGQGFADVNQPRAHKPFPSQIPKGEPSTRPACAENSAHSLGLRGRPLVGHRLDCMLKSGHSMGRS
jgi:hypothetical protein